MDDFKYLFKIVLVGDSGVGKTCLIGRYMDKTFLTLTGATIGVDFRIKTFSVDDVPIKLQLWDTSGQERFHSITNQYYRNASAIIIAYDITNATSFENVSHWWKNIQDLASANVLIFLVGTKSDILEEREVNFEDAERFANSTGMKLIETSALTGEKIDELFLETARTLTEKAKLSDLKYTSNVIIRPSDGAKVTRTWNCC